MDPCLSEHFIHPGLLASLFELSSAPPSLLVVIITCLILSNLSFVLANQLLRCTLLHHFLSCDSFVFSITPLPSPQLPALTCYSLFIPCYSLIPHLYLSCAFPCHGIRVNLDPSKRQGSNKSVSGCTLPQGSKAVSKLPCVSLLSCLACASPSLPGHTGRCVPDFFIHPSITYCLPAWFNHLHHVKVPHMWLRA